MFARILNELCGIIFIYNSKCKKFQVIILNYSSNLKNLANITGKFLER